MELLTDLPPQQAQDLIVQLLWFDQVTQHFVPPAANEDPPSLRLVVFSNQKVFRRVVKYKHFAAYTQPEISGTTLVVGPDEEGGVVLSTLHEYVHYRLRTQTIAFPKWYDEGLAVLLSAVEFNFSPHQPDGEVQRQYIARVGHRLPNLLVRDTTPMPPLNKLLDQGTLTWPTAGLAGYYKLSAHLLQHLLYASPPDGVSYRTVLNDHLHNRTQSLTVMLGEHAEFLRKSLRRHRHNTLPGETLMLTPPAQLHHATRIDPLTPTHLLELKAEVAQSPNPGYAARLYRKLAGQHADNPRYWALLSRVNLDLSLPRAEQALTRAIALDPEHPDVLISQALADIRRCPLDQSLSCLDQWRSATIGLRKVLDHNPEHFQAILWLGVIELYAGRAGSAINYLKIAHNRAPWSALVNFHLGECLRLLGNPRARAHLEQAIWWADDAHLRNLAETALATFNHQHPPSG